MLRNMRMKENALGTNHPEVAATFQQLAHLSEAQGDWRRALSYVEESSSRAITYAQEKEGEVSVSATPGAPSTNRVEGHVPGNSGPQ